MTFQWIGIQLWTEVAVRSGYSWIAVRIFFYSVVNWLEMGEVRLEIAIR